MPSKRVQLTTLHSVMNDQPLIDGYHHRDLNLTRSAMQSAVPVSTGLARGVERLLPELDGRVHARAIRVPTHNASSIDMVLSVARHEWGFVSRLADVTRHWPGAT
ncbi:hypothetical protein ACFPTO_18305 [Paraburkholderia denitrificans]|uniref:Glyceraldehyde 3-phosphate dehydrogenase catalytic domain-containing protein n=1 Tax=Paraburkholderia denitrificans TaxID=694025 RepID=A0ABW0JCV9_9BURK